MGYSEWPIQTAGAENVGTGQGNVYKGTSNGTLQFKTLKEGGGITITDNTSDVTLTVSGAGTGDVVGPSSSVDSEFALFSLTTGKVIKRATGTGFAKSTSGVFSVVASINLAADVSTSVLPVANGGTNLASYTAGDLPYASGATTISKLAIGAANTVLVSSGTAPSWASIVNANIDAAAAIAFSKLAALTSGNILVGSAGNVATSVAMSGDTTISNAGVVAIGANKVSLAMMAQVATARFLGRTTAGTGDVESLTATQATALLNNVVGDSGAGGTKGLVPAPAAGDAAANKFLKADGTWTAPSGSGDVVGPASSVASEIVLFDGATGKLIKAATGTGLVKATSGVYSAATLVNADVSASAAIDFSKLAALTSANILVGNVSNVATSVAVSGDVTISNAGVVAIASGVIVNSDVNASAAIDFSKLAALTSANILVGNASNVATSVAVSGDVTISNAGVVAIAAGAIVDADVNASAAIARTKLASGTASHVIINDGSGVFSSEATLATSRGGTNIASFTTGDILYASSSSVLSKLAIGSTGQVLTVASGLPSWATGGGGSGDVVGPASATDNAATRFDSTTGKLVQNSALIISDVASLVLTISQPDDAVADANSAARTFMRAANKTQGTGSGGDFKITGGDSTGGTVGKVYVGFGAATDANSAVFQYASGKTRVLVPNPASIGEPGYSFVGASSSGFSLVSGVPAVVVSGSAKAYFQSSDVQLDDADLRISTAGRGLNIKEGSNARMGSVALTAGAATVSTTEVSANSRIFLTSQADGGTVGFLRVSARTAATSFTITSSSGSDTSTVAWLIVEPD